MSYYIRLLVLCLLLATTTAQALTPLTIPAWPSWGGAGDSDGPGDDGSGEGGEGGGDGGGGGEDGGGE